MNSVVVVNNHIGLKMEKMFFRLRKDKLIRIVLHNVFCTYKTSF